MKELLGKGWFDGSGISQRDFWTVFTLLFNTFTWFYMLLVIIDQVSISLNLEYSVRTIFYIAVTGSALAGSLIAEDVRRLRFLYSWMVFGIASSFVLALVYSFAPSLTSIVSVPLGLSFGIGMPSCLAYLADQTQTENRGLVSSLILLSSNLIAFPLALIFMTASVTIFSVILVIWRVFGLLSFASLKPKESFPIKEQRRYVSFSSVLQNRQFALYLIPWLMFSFVDRFEKIVFGNYIEPDFYRSLLSLGPMIGSLSILVTGLLCDKIGRKKVLIYGFILLGVAYALIGIAPTMGVSWYLYLALDSVAAGILSLIFHFVVWGDLSQRHMREKYYVVGSIPVFLTEAISLPLAPYIKLIPATSSFSLASFFLFMAVLPLIYAPETLPEKKIQMRQLRGYAEKAKKLREKYLKRNGAG